MSVRSSEKMQHLNVLLKAARNHLNDFDKQYIKECIKKAENFYCLKFYNDALNEINDCINYLQDFVRSQLKRKE